MQRTLTVMAAIVLLAGAVCAQTASTFGWMQANATDTVDVKKKEPVFAEPVDPPGSVSILWNSHDLDAPGISASYRLVEQWNWTFYGDVFYTPASETCGAGVSAEAPVGTPVIDQLRAMTNADRGGVASLYDGATDEWGLMLYLCHDIASF